MSKTKYRCVVCNALIPPERVERALARGKQPMYDSDTCANTAAVRRYRKSKGSDVDGTEQTSADGG